jgi:gamma-butyrobetaine dioxygenase
MTYAIGFFDRALQLNSLFNSMQARQPDRDCSHSAEVCAMTGAALSPPAAPAPDPAVEARTTPGRTRAQPIVDMTELAHYSSERRIRAAESSERQISVAWDDGSVQRFHPLWLRSECACPACRDRVTLERTFDHFRLPLDLEPAMIEVTEAGALRLAWSPDGHISQFDPGWLHQVTHGGGLLAAAGGAAQLWRAELADAIPTFGYDAIMADPGALHGWLTALRDTGLTLLEGVPTQPGEVDRIARRISLPRDSNFGVVFDVVTMVNANSNAYTAIELPPHVDLPTREYQPGFQFFHCLDNEAVGGESTYVDGLAVAEHLRAEEPEIFAELSTTAVGFRFHDQGCDYAWRSPVVVLDRRGALAEIRFNPWLTMPLAAPPERFEPVYLALRRFGELTRDQRFQIRLRLAAGTMSAFDNRRVLHGRAAFEPSSGRRHFQGCYVEREEILSRILVLERQL